MRTTRRRSTLLLLVFIVATVVTLPAGADNAKIRANWYEDGSPCLITRGLAGSYAGSYVGSGSRQARP